MTSVWSLVACLMLCLLAYSYVGYPALMALLARLFPRPWLRSESHEPTISVVLAARNEERVIADCLLSLLALDYPKSKLEILVGSDGSTDSTNAILAEFAAQYPQVRPFYYSESRGKMHTLNDIVQEAQFDILLFVDADVTLAHTAARAHSRNYADMGVGGVSGGLIYRPKQVDGVYQAESQFWKLEKDLRKHEALVWSTVGLYGGNYSMLRRLWRPLPNARTCDDFLAVLSIIDQGMRLVYEEEASSTELYGRTLLDEYHRKTRYASRSLYSLTFYPHLLFRWPALALLWPHKVLRWTTGPIAILCMLSTVLAISSGTSWLWFAAIGEVLGILLIAFGWAADRRGRVVPVASNIYWFYRMNLGFMRGIWESLFSKQKILWSQPTRVTPTEISPSPSKEALPH